MTRWRRSFWVLLLAVVALGFARLKFQTDPLDLLPPDLPEVQGLKWQQEHLSNPDETLITIVAEPGQGIAAAKSLASHLQEQREVRECLWQRRLEDNAGFVAEMAAYLWLNGGPEELAQLTNRFDGEGLERRLREVTETLAVTLSPEAIARLSFDPVGWLESPAAKRLLSARALDPFQSADGTFRIIRVQPRETLSDHWDCIAWMEFLRFELAEWRRQNPKLADAVGAITGRPSFVAESAASMERDMERAIPMTAFFVVLLFFIAHRSLRPVLIMVALMTVVLVLSVALAGLVLGTLNAISLGFAAILLGVCADYALVLYAEYRVMGSAEAARAATGRGIVWSAVTTAMAFAALLIGGLPGLGQLGILVAIGVLLGAVVFLRSFLNRVEMPQPPTSDVVEVSGGLPKVLLLAMVAGVILVLFVKGRPGFSSSGEALQAQDSEALAGVRQISERMVGNSEGWLLFVAGKDGAELAARSKDLESKLELLRTRKAIAGYLLPRGMLPDVENQRANAPALSMLVGQTEVIEKAVAEAGFGDDALALQRTIFAAWTNALTQNGAWLPANEEARGLVRQAGWQDAAGMHLAGWLDPMDVGGESAVWLADEGVVIASWSLLGQAVWERVSGRLNLLLLVVGPLVLLALGLALGRGISVLLCSGALALGLAMLFAGMSLLDWEWNIINVAALPVLLGLGVDYGIHLLLARERLCSLGETWKGTGRAILLCAGTSFAAFVSLAFAGNPVLSEFGKVCALGVCAMWVSANLVVFSGLGNARERSSRISGPSRSYGAAAWGAGLRLIRRLPRGLAMGVARFCSGVYGSLRSERMEIVTKNLAPLTDTPERDAQRLFRNFGGKLVDLWRFEAGCDMKDRFADWRGWEHLESARKSGNGVLLVTIHLGNWELGSAAIKAKGMDLVVLSNPEPDPRLTEMREAARKRMGIETIIVGDDPFAFVEVIRRLREGAAVALLLDRPAAATATEVKLFDRPFYASIGPAELARASGVALLPVVVVMEDDRYSAQVLGRVEYDRAKLRDPAERVAVTRQLLRAFEPVLQQYPDQWYHFVPIWPESS